MSHLTLTLTPNPNPNYHVLTFRWTFERKVAKTASFREKARKLIDLAKTMQLFLTNYHVLVFRWTFQQKVAKSGSIREKARKSSIWPKLCNFSNKLPCLCISTNFSGKSCRKCLISWKSTRNHRFVQNFAIFKKTTMSLHFDQLFRKKLQKVPHFVKKHEKPSIWQKLAIFRANYHVLAFSWTFQKEVAKSASFREKAREIIDFANTMQLFEQTTMFFAFRWTFKEKVGKSGSSREKARKIMDLAKLATFRPNYHVLVFRWTFRQTVA